MKRKKDSRLPYKLVEPSSLDILLEQYNAMFDRYLEAYTEQQKKRHYSFMLETKERERLENKRRNIYRAVMNDLSAQMLTLDLLITDRTRLKQNPDHRLDEVY